MAEPWNVVEVFYCASEETWGFLFREQSIGIIISL